MMTMRFLVLVVFMTGAFHFSALAARCGDPSAIKKLREELLLRQAEFRSAHDLVHAAVAGNSDRSGLAELGRAEVNLAEIRGRLAIAEGRNKQAVAEFRKVLSYREIRHKVLQELLARGIHCGGGDLQLAEGELAIARVNIAQAEKDWKSVVAESPSVIAFYERQAQDVELLLKRAVIAPVEAGAMLRDFRQKKQAARDVLDSASNRLKAGRS